MTEWLQPGRYPASIFPRRSRRSQLHTEISSVFSSCKRRSEMKGACCKLAMSSTTSDKIRKIPTYRVVET